MTEKLEKIFNPFSLLILNVVIIILAELMGGGTFFYRTNLIHVIALFFIVLAFLRVRAHYYSFDVYFENVIHAGFIAMAIFAASHIFEAISFVEFHAYSDAVFASVVHFYLASFLVIIIGTELFFKKIYSRSYALAWILVLGIAALAILTFYVMKNASMISLEPGSIAVPLYTVVALSIGAYAFFRLWQIKKHVPLATQFVNYYMAALFLIGIAALINVYYEVLVDKFNVPEFQVIYLSHFVFYGALSVIFLAFGNMHNLGGIYQGLDQSKEYSKK